MCALAYDIRVRFMTATRGNPPWLPATRAGTGTRPYNIRVRFAPSNI